MGGLLCEAEKLAELTGSESFGEGFVLFLEAGYKWSSSNVYLELYLLKYVY